jgi:DNA primase
METADLDYVAVAPEGKEVEELSKKEVFKALREKISASQFKLDKRNQTEKSEPTQKEPPKKDFPKKDFPKPTTTKITTITEDQKKTFNKTIEELIGTRAACIFDSSFNLLGKVPVKELQNTLKTLDKPYAVIFDGRVDYKLDMIARRKGIKFLVGMEKENIKSPVNILSKSDIA